MLLLFKEAAKLSEVCQNKSLKAEIHLMDAMVQNSLPAKRNETQKLQGVVKKLLAARKVNNQEGGEFTTLSTLIYKYLADIYEVECLSLFNFSYECLRRVWLINRQIYGRHHCLTERAGAALEQARYVDIAKQKGDTLPSDDCHSVKDIKYEQRLKPMLSYKFES